MTIEEIKSKVIEVQEELKRCKSDLRCYIGMNDAEAIRYTKANIVTLGKYYLELKQELEKLQSVQRIQKAVLLDRDEAAMMIRFVKMSGCGEIIGVSGCGNSLYVQAMVTEAETEAINKYIDNVITPAMNLGDYIKFLAIECGLGSTRAEEIAYYTYKGRC
jgi:hypothetical protein